MGCNRQRQTCLDGPSSILLATIKPERTLMYPTFAQSRFMAYDAIVHGARGILYWGSQTIDDPAFRQSLYALTSEIAAIQPLLVGIEHDDAFARTIDDLFDPPGLGVRTLLKQNGSTFLLILVNEDAHRHLGVDVTGLKVLEGRILKRLYGSETVKVERAGFLTRMQGFEVKVFSTNPSLESPRLEGRDYVQNEP